MDPNMGFSVGFSPKTPTNSMKASGRWWAMMVASGYGVRKVPEFDKKHWRHLWKLNLPIEIRNFFHPENEHDIGKSPCSIGNTSLNGGFKDFLNIFTPILGKWSYLTNIFQMGWFNHQPRKSGKWSESNPPFLGFQPFIFQAGIFLARLGIPSFTNFIGVKIHHPKASPPFLNKNGGNDLQG